MSNIARKVVGAIICWFLFLAGALFAGPVKLDKFCNALYFRGDPRESISSHTGRWYVSGLSVPARFRFVKWFTDLFVKDHVLNSIEADFTGLPL